MISLKESVFVLILTLVGVAMVACGKDDDGDKKATPTAETTQPAEEKVYVTSIKCYPIENSELCQELKLSSYYEEYTFDENGKCTGFEQDCILKSEEDCGEIKSYLETKGCETAWSDSKNFVITEKKDGATIEDAKKNFAAQHIGYIIRYSDGNTETVDE